MAEFVKWNGDYSVGIKEVDEQHKALVGIINRLYTAFMEHNEDKIMGQILDDLASYVNYHFKHEENLMLLHQYPNVKPHIEKHKEFVGKVQKFKEEHVKSKKITYSVLNFLRTWILEHIQGTDKEYTAHLNGKGVS